MKKNNDIFEVSIHLEKPNTLKDLYPKEKHSHVSLVLTGEIGVDDVNFLNGDMLSRSYYDEDTGEKIDVYVNPYWDTYDLKTIDVIFPSNLPEFKNISAIECHNSILKFVDKYHSIFFSWYKEISDIWYKSVTKIIISSIVPEPNFFSPLEHENLKEIVLEKGNTAFKIIDGVLYSKDKMRLILYPPQLTNEHYVIPEGTVAIRPYAFTNCLSLKSITIPQSMTRIETDAFLGCINLETFHVHCDNPYYYICRHALCERVQRYNHRFDEKICRIIQFPPAFPGTNVKVSIGVFWDKDIETVEIAPHAFSGCKYIVDLEIDNGDNCNMDDYLFMIPNLVKFSIAANREPDVEECYKLKKITLQEREGWFSKISRSEET